MANLDGGEARIRLLGIVGAKEPFLQGSSVMLTIPSRMVKKYNLKEKAQDKSLTFAFLETDKGILLVPLNDLVYRPDTLKDILGFIKVSGTTPEDLKLMFEDDEPSD